MGGGEGGRERYGQVVDIKRMITKNKSRFFWRGDERGGVQGGGRGVSENDSHM